MVVLVTGFDPFGGESVNPSFEAVSRLPDSIEGAKIVKKQLPTEFKKASEVLIAALEEFRPNVVICVGQAGGRSCISIERVAVNLRDAKIADNVDCCPVDEPIYKDCETACFSNLPTREIMNVLCKAGIPASLSYTAGTFVCNEVLYTLLQYIRVNDLCAIGGFIHVPYIPEQTATKAVNMPSMSLEMIINALELSISTALQTLTLQ